MYRLITNNDKVHNPTPQRRCRVALLPDCHVRFGWNKCPQQATRRLYGAARHLLETYHICVDGIASQVYDIQEQDLAQLSRLAYGADYAERYGAGEDRNFWWSWRT